MGKDTMDRATLTLEGARKILDGCVAAAGDLSVVIVVADPSGEPIMTARMDGAPLLSVGVARDKAWTVASFGEPTHWWAEALAADPSLQPLANGRPLMAVPGGVPVVVDDVVVGAVGVSGGSAEQDLSIARAGASTVG